MTWHSHPDALQCLRQHRIKRWGALWGALQFHQAETCHFMSFLQIHKKWFIEIRIHVLARALLNSTIKVQNWIQRCGLKFPSAGSQRNDAFGFCSTQSQLYHLRDILWLASTCIPMTKIDLGDLGLSCNPSQKMLPEESQSAKNNFIITKTTPFLKTWCGPTIWIVLPNQ